MSRSDDLSTSFAKVDNAEVNVETAESVTTSCVSDVKSASPLPGSPHSYEKNSPQEDNCASDSRSKPSTTHFSKSTGASASPALVAFQCSDAQDIAASPRLPRLKLRKSAKSSSQAGAAAVGKEGDSLKPKPGRRKKKDSEPSNNSVITDYFQVRRSGRQTKSEIQREKQHQLEQMILSGCEHGLEIKEFDCKGRGVVATKDFKKGDFVVEYAGDLIDIATAKQREEKYEADPEIGCYMYYFKCGTKQHCVDATAESGKLGRLLNHSSKGGNCCTRSLEVKGVARLILEAKRDITKGEELTYDYGDRSKASIESHPWLKL
ncbi:histone-lysine N-methyltransferase [Elysia marginata]|uniref:[histone H4]-lysine(20) N-methyltransferase n=1 Tax=Elysia marginata TaxID=1093978 RepID=A0AAV4JET4_9GAST|nr:histone-lysine N-methyltransferase [Elysia marginata]